MSMLIISRRRGLIRKSYGMIRRRKIWKMRNVGISIKIRKLKKKSRS